MLMLETNIEVTKLQNVCYPIILTWRIWELM